MDEQTLLPLRFVVATPTHHFRQRCSDRRHQLTESNQGSRSVIQHCTTTMRVRMAIPLHENLQQYLSNHGGPTPLKA
jgi:hypothetical protein